ncbi:MAG: hypothetical protein VCC19_07145 [Myxococcota bacterium]
MKRREAGPLEDRTQRESQDGPALYALSAQDDTQHGADPRCQVQGRSNLVEFDHVSSSLAVSLSADPERK